MGSRSRWFRASSVPWFLGFALLAVAWALSNPLGASPDERAHYVKTLGAALGQGAGAPVPPRWPRSTAREQLLARLYGVYAIPPALGPDPHWECTKFSQAAAHCLNLPLPASRRTPFFWASLSATQMARYPAAPYHLMGAVARWMPSRSDALYAGRLTSALLSVALLASAFAVAKPGWARVGVLAATSPMVVFLAASLTTSGIETAAGIAHATTIVAIGTGSRLRKVLAVYALSGFCLALTRPSGAFIVLLYMLFAVLFIGRRAAGLFRAHAVVVSSALGVVVLSAAGAAFWSARAIPRTSAPVSETLGFLYESLERSIRGVPQLVGSFGWLDTPMPTWAYVVAAAAYLALLSGALLLGTRRDRWMLIFAVVMSALVNVWLDAATQIPYQFPFQARFCLPFTVVVPVLCGAVIGQSHAQTPIEAHGRGRNELALLSISWILVGLHAIAWWANSRRSAVGAGGSWHFVAEGAWSPPIGWTIPIVLCGVGILVLGAACVANARPSVREIQSA